MKLIYTHPTQYGYYLREKDCYPPLRTYRVTITKPVDDLYVFAMEHGISYLILKEFNPWLRQSHLKNKEGRTYTIKVPKKNFLVYSKLWDADTEDEVILGDTLNILHIQ